MSRVATTRRIAGYAKSWRRSSLALTKADRATSATFSAAPIPRIFLFGDHLLHDRVQVLQLRRTAERLAAHPGVVGDQVIPQLDRSCEGVHSVREVELIPHNLSVVVCVSEFG